MFNNPVIPSKLIDEGTVMQVDPLRSVCKVITSMGQRFDQVRFSLPAGGSSRGGDRVTPVFGDRVKLDYSLGYPVISGFLPKTQLADNTFPVSIDSGAQLIDTGNFASDGVNAIDDQNKPKDILAGDRVISATGGGVLAVLRSGSIIVRSSKLSEIYLSKWGDLVRIVSRNWEHFTDVCSDVVRNIHGSVYRYIGYANSFDAAKSESYQYHEYYGNVAMAEATKTNYKTTVPAGGAPSGVIYKQQITGSGQMYRTLSLDGSQEVWISSGGTFTRMNSDGSQLKLSFGDSHTVTIDTNHIFLDFGGAQTVEISGDKIEFIHSGGAKTTIDSTGSKTTFSGHFCNVTAGGVQLG